MEKTPKYLVRPTDFSLFVKTESGEYTHELNVRHKWTGNTYTYERLVDSFNFFPCTEKELKKIKEKNDLYYKWMSWTTRSDGHGGVKGGTFEEFLKLQKK